MREHVDGHVLRIPRLYAAASLKQWSPGRRGDHVQAGIPRLYAAASLKPLAGIPGRRVVGETVFRGFMPRPH